MPKSAFFQSMDLESDDGKKLCRMLDIAASLDGEALRSLARDMPEMSKLRTKKLREQYADRQVAKLGITRLQAGAAVEEVFVPLLSTFLDERTKGDRPQDLVDDMLEFRLIKTSDAEKMRSAIAIIRSEVAPKVEATRLYLRHAAGAFPSFSGIDITVEMRGVVKSEYHFGDDVEKYVPEIVGEVPVASIKIVLDSGSPKEFCFQADIQDLEWLVDQLNATRKDLHAFQERAGTNRDND